MNDPQTFLRRGWHLSVLVEVREGYEKHRERYGAGGVAHRYRFHRRRTCRR